MQITNEINVSSSYMLPVFNAWNDFLATQDLDSFSYETFLSVGAPWAKTAPLDKAEIRKLYKDISSRLPFIEKEVAKSIRALIRKRMIFALRAESDLRLKTWLAFNGVIQVPNIARDLLIRKHHYSN